MKTHGWIFFGAAVWAACLVVACGSDGGQGRRVDAAAPPVPVCGNSVTEAGESCDGTDLNGYTCATVAAELTSGTLACRADCTGYDISRCAAEGQTIDASSCEQDDVQAVIDSAADGDTVNVPAGQCTWTSDPGCDGRAACAPVRIIEKSIALKGAGPGNTVITSNVPEGWQYSTLFVESLEGLPFRVSGFTITEIIAPAVSIAGSNRMPS